MPLKHSEATREQCEAMTRSGSLARPSHTRTAYASSTLTCEGSRTGTERRAAPSAHLRAAMRSRHTA
jgi:hypothetical protein